MAVHHLASISSAIGDKRHVVVVINTIPAPPTVLFRLCSG